MHDFYLRLNDHVLSNKDDYFMRDNIEKAINNTACIPKIAWDKDTREYCRDSVVMNKYKTVHKVVKDNLFDVLNAYSPSAVVLIGGEFITPCKPIGSSLTLEQEFALGSGWYEILDAYKIRYFLPHVTCQNGGMYEHSALMSIGTPYQHNGVNGLINVISSSCVNFNVIRNQPNSKKKEFLDKGNKIMQERQEFVYLLAASMGVPTFIAGPWGCKDYHTSSESIARGWLNCTMKYPGVFREIVHPCYSGKGSYYVFKDLLEV